MLEVVECPTCGRRRVWLRPGIYLTHSGVLKKGDKELLRRQMLMKTETGEKRCPRCKGTGTESDNVQDCTLCDGKKKVTFTKIGDNEIINRKKARFVG